MLDGILTQGNAIDWRIALISILMAFGITQAISAVYVWTFRGLSYSRTLVQSMAMASIVTCTLMLSLGDSIAASIGIAVGGIQDVTLMMQEPTLDL